MGKISSYPAATTLQNADLVPIVQGGATKKGTMAQLKTFMETGEVSVAAAEAESDFLAGAGSPVVWARKTLAQIKAILGVDTLGTAAALDADSVALKSDLAGIQGDTIIQDASPVGTYFVNGVSVVWVSGYTYRIGACSKYFIDGVECSSEEQEVTASAADGSNDRIDVFALNAAGEAVIIPGTPAEVPAKPEVDPSLYAEFSFIYVAASSTEPEVDQNDIYKEGGEWTCTVSAGSPATITLDSTNNPRTGTKCIEGTNVVKAQYVQAVSSVSFNPATSNLLAFYIRLKAAWASTKAIRLTWLSGATMIGARILVGNGKYGLDTTATGAYQQVVIPMSVFKIPAGTTVDRLRFEIVGSGDNVGFYLDDWIMQAGVAPVEEVAPPLTVRGVWATGDLYARFDIVSRSGSAYIALAANQGKAPESNSAYWFKLGTTTQRTMLAMLLDKDVALAVGTSLGNVQIPIPAEWAGLTLTDAQLCLSPLGTAQAAGNVTFQLVRTRPTSSPAAVDMLAVSPAWSIAQDEKTSSTPAIDTANDDLAAGDFISVDCESIGSPAGAKGPLWLKITAE